MEGSELSPLRSLGYVPANVCLSAPTESLVALHIARMSGLMNYSPNVAAAAEYFQTVIRGIFENAIDQESSANVAAWSFLVARGLPRAK